MHAERNKVVGVLGLYILIARKRDASPKLAAAAEGSMAPFSTNPLVDASPSLPMTPTLRDGRYGSVVNPIFGASMDRLGRTSGAARTSTSGGARTSEASMLRDLCVELPPVEASRDSEAAAAPV